MLRLIGTLTGEVILPFSSCPLLNGCTLEEYTLNSEGNRYVAQGSKHEVTLVVSLGKHGKNHFVPMHPNLSNSSTRMPEQAVGLSS